MLHKFKQCKHANRCKVKVMGLVSSASLQERGTARSVKDRTVFASPTVVLHACKVSSFQSNLRSLSTEDSTDISANVQLSPVHRYSNVVLVLYPDTVQFLTGLPAGCTFSVNIVARCC